MLILAVDYPSLIACVAGFMLLLFVRQTAMRQFRDPDKAVEPPSWWAGDPALWRVWDRTQGPANIVGVILVLFLGVTALSNDTGLAAIAEAFLISALFLGTGLCFSTGFLASPQALVPYRYRGRPNYFEERNVAK
jgi:hypothetical protein